MRGALLVIALVYFSASAANADVRHVWAVNDGEKVERDAVEHRLRARNSVWDGDVVRITGARNEIVAFQVIVEADGRGISALSLRLPALSSIGDRADRANTGDRIVYKPPAPDPTDYVGRPIQIFGVNYMQVTTSSHASWVYTRGSPAAPPDPTGWKPVQLVPENARAGRGGFPIAVAANQSQAIWVEVYIDRVRKPGRYRGTIEIRADAARRTLPIELEVYDFVLPDDNSMHAMLYYSSDQAERYQGRNLDPAFHRLAHRHRVELVHAYDEQTIQKVWGRFSGTDFTQTNGFEGPGAGVGNVIAPRTFYGPGRDFDERSSAWTRSDSWMTFIRAKLPRAITFLYVPDEPRPPEYPRIVTLADNIRSNPGPGRTLPLFVTSTYVEPLDAAIDIWCSGPKGFKLDRVAAERARGREYWFYNGGRPAGGAITIDAPATDARATIWAAFKHDVRVYFYWHSVHWRHNAQMEGERNQNVWASSITFDNRKQANRSPDDQGYIHGDGVLIYPGEERLHPEEDRAVPGPIATIQLANFRRGLQDHQYLTMARSLGLNAVVDDVLKAIVPRVFSDAGERVSFPETGDPYEAARFKLAAAITQELRRRAQVADDVRSKPRVFVLTDIENEPDDAQSLVRFLTYANHFDVEGLVATTSVHQRDKTAAWRIRDIVEAYGKVRETLEKHEPGFPDAQRLLSVIKEGRPAFGMSAVGEGKDSSGSDALIAAVDRDDPRPLWVPVWGGPNVLAQALWKVRATRSPEALARFVAKLRVYTISDQDDSGPWIRKTFPNLFYIASPGLHAGGAYHFATWSGISGDTFHARFTGADFSLVDNPWLEQNIRRKGPLGAQYPRVEFLMEGDTPSFLGLVNNGLSVPERPDWGGWGGRYEQYTPRTQKWFQEPETRPIWTDAVDEVRGVDNAWHTSNHATIWRWRSAYQNDFAARMDWTIKPYAEANHPPRPALAHAPELSAKPGERVNLSAEGSSDPDGDALSYEWFYYGEAGTFTTSSGRSGQPMTIQNFDQPRAWFTVPSQRVMPPGKGTMHVILAVTDHGTPRLTRYRRVIVTVVP